MKANHKTASSRGFTLIEVIVSLILVGIMASMAGMGIVSATKAFIFTKEAAEISQKTQLAMNRLTKSIANWTSFTTTLGNQLTLTREDKITGGTVTETYSYSGNALSLTVGGVTDVLCDGLTAFNLEYLRSDMGGDSFWSTGQPISNLNMVRVTMTQAGQSGANSGTFTSRVVPANTSRGDVQALQAKYGTGSGGCFVATAAYGDHDDPAVVLLRQFRDRVLSQNDTGKKFISWYYREGPALAGFISGHPAARWPARFLLAPVVGMVFLMLYFPSGLILIPVMTLLLLRLGYAFFTKGPRGRMIKPLSMRGSILIGLIITMVIMSALGAAMVPIFSASNMGNVASMFQPRANYMAESGFSYAVKEYLRLDTEANIEANHNRAFTLANSDSFKTFIYPYWFRNPNAMTAGSASLVVNSVATVNGMDSFPTKFQDTETVSVNRWIRVGSADYRSYTTATYDSANHTVTFGGLGPTPTTAIAANQVVYPAAQTSASAQIIYPEGMSTSSQIFRISNSANLTALADFPKNRGVISFSVSGTTYTVTYDTVGSDGIGPYFQGLHNVPSATLMPIESSGRSVPANTMVYLGKHAEIKSKGIAGIEGGGFTAERMLNYDQSLVKIDAWKKTTLEKKGQDLADDKTDLVGTSAYDSTVGALKVTTAVDAVSFMEEGVKGSLVREYVAGIAVPELQQAWANSGNTLSYDLQIKMRFSAGDENTTGTSTKTPGSYMPGLAFRLTGTTTTNLKFYGLSVMRGIQGATGSAPARDRDGVSDYLFKAWPNNSGATAPDAGQLACLRETNADYQWTTWSSTPPRDGRPYVILWQRDITLNEEGGWSSSWSQQEAQMDWLAYKETCADGLEAGNVGTPPRRTLYRYGAGSTPAPGGDYVEGWYDGVIPSTVAPTGDNVLTAIRLVDQSNILATTVNGGVTILGQQAKDTGYAWIGSTANTASSVGIVRNPATGFPMPPMSVTTIAGRTYANRPVAYIFPGTGETGARTHDFLKNNNYRIYPKEWITLMVQLFELKGDFDCDGAQDDKVNVLQVHYGDPDGLAPPSGLYGDPKSIYRRAEPRGQIRWPEDGNYLTTTVWNEKAVAANTYNFTSNIVSVASSWGWNYWKKLVDKAYDSTAYINPLEKDWPTVYTDWYKSPSSGALSAFEVGLHAMGIDAPNDRAFFDDFAINIYEKTATGLLPGLRSE